MSQLHLQVLEPVVIRQVVDEALQVLENPGARTMQVPWIYWKQQAHWSIAIPRLPASRRP